MMQYGAAAVTYAIHSIYGTMAYSTESHHSLQGRVLAPKKLPPVYGRRRARGIVNRHEHGVVHYIDVAEEFSIGLKRLSGRRSGGGSG